MPKTIDATEIVNGELDKLADKHGKGYARSVSSAFCAIQLMQMMSVLYLAAKGESTEQTGITPDEAMARFPVFLSQILGMVSHKLDEGQRRGVQEDAQRIYDTAIAIAMKNDHVLQ